MKFIIKLVVTIVVIVVAIFLIQALFPDLAENTWKLATAVVNYTKIKETGTTIGGNPQITPVFKIVSLEVFYPKNIALTKVDVRKILGLEFGTVTLIYEYDMYLSYFIRDPKEIIIERPLNLNTLIIDESSINIELAVSIKNYRHIETYSSGTARPNMPDHLVFESWNNLQKELEDKMKETAIENFESAKRNFKQNYENMVKEMNYEVVWK